MEQPLSTTDRSPTPSVAIDGARIKGVRETKKLTQLYVANLVGVTTDTISRWENNRYPTIKRDNAEKLASALEVDLAEILRQEDPAGEAETVPRPLRRGVRPWLLGLAGLALCVVAAVFLLNRRIPAHGAVRWAPHFAAPGETIPVQIKITPAGGEDLGFILKEKLPEGWRLVSAVPASSSADPSGSEIKWLIPGGSRPVTVSYSVRLPAALAPGKETMLHGEMVLPAAGLNRTEPVAGSGSIRIGAYHWADSNGDGRIDDEEIMPAYYLCEEMKGIALDWKTIEAIWSGKGYRWDAKSGFTVLK
jgi:transcriptional regulator with XRE-family HTH domain